MAISEAAADCRRVLNAVGDAVIADPAVLETVFLGVLARGHVLLEDVPGTGKTLTARSFASALGLSFSRIQFTPDLLPADVTGSYVFDEQAGTFEFNPGPIFASVVLADEINRAPPKTQAALLEAMEEAQVTVGDETHDLPSPFFVIATQNPVEQEGTFPLPEAQLDRFLVKLSLGMPDQDGLTDLLRRRAGRTERSPSVDSVLDEGRVADLRYVPEEIDVDDDLLGYMAQLGVATREHTDVEVGVSPQGVQRLFEASRAHAVLNERSFVSPDDIRAVADPVLAHRLVLTPEATIGDTTKRAVVDDILSAVPVPTIERHAD
jgi:MoxR-like ATPase